MLRLFVIFLLSASLSGCYLFSETRVRHDRSTSLVEFLYPDGQIPEDSRHPVLNLPLRVGLAFIPDAHGSQTISSATRVELLDRVSQAFESRVYVDSITIIPEMYLRGNQGFVTLEQVRQIYQLDVIALVSYDQIVHRKENLLALTYLTIAGAYIFPGSHYDVSTLVDLAVIDIDSRQLLFRAAGTQSSKGMRPEAYTPQAYSDSQNQDFDEAMVMMQTNLQLELAAFEQRLREKRPDETITVNHRQGYSGATDLWLLILLGAGLVIRARAVAAR